MCTWATTSYTYLHITTFRLYFTAIPSFSLADPISPLHTRTTTGISTPMAKLQGLDRAVLEREEAKEVVKVRLNTNTHGYRKDRVRR